MDVYCKYCREPWDSYEFHDAAKCLRNEGIEASYESLYRSFREFGCEAVLAAWDGYVAAKPCRYAPEAKPAEIAEVLGDLFGDDFDGLTAELNDAMAAGLYE